jgi:hypothetical protein
MLQQYVSFCLMISTFGICPPFLQANSGINSNGSQVHLPSPKLHIALMPESDLFRNKFEVILFITALL